MIRRTEISNFNHRFTRTVTTNTTVKADEDILLVDATAGNVTVTLPDAVGLKNLYFSVKKIDSSANTVILTPVNGQKIDNASTQTITSQWDVFELSADGTNWQTVSIPTTSGAGGFNGGTITNPLVISSANTNALEVGPNGATNPVFNIDSSVTSAATGITIQGKAAGSGVVLSAISSGTNESIILAAKGTGSISVQLETTPFHYGSSATTSDISIQGAQSWGGYGLSLGGLTPSYAMLIDTTNGNQLRIFGQSGGTRSGNSIIFGINADILSISGSGLTLYDGKNIVLGSTSGNQIGTATTQKIGFFGATPVVQPAASADVTGFAAGVGTASKSDSTWTGVSGASAYTVGGIVTRLKALGLLAA